MHLARPNHRLQVLINGIERTLGVSNRIGKTNWKFCVGILHGLFNFVGPVGPSPSWMYDICVGVSLIKCMPCNLIISYCLGFLCLFSRPHKKSSDVGPKADGSFN